MFGLGHGEMPPLRLTWYLTRDVRFAMIAGIIGAMPVVPALRVWADRTARRWQGLAAEAVGTLALLAIFVAAIVQVAARTYNPFIYFRF